MLIPSDEAEQFHCLYQPLLGFAAGKLGAVAGVTNLASFRDARMTAKVKVRDALLDHPELIDRYVAEELDHKATKEQQIILQWKRFVRGEFAILRDLKRYTIFLTTKQPYVAYGALGLTTEIAELVPVPLPALADATLLPWKGRIVCDGLVSAYRITLGPGYRRELEEAYREATSERGLVTSLDPPDSGSQQRLSQRPRLLSPLEKFLKSCPHTVTEFKERHGEPRLEMGNRAAREYGPWRLNGTPALEADHLMIYGNILKDQVLYVYSVKGNITHFSVVDPTDWGT